MTKIKRYFSLFLVFALVLSCFPAFSFANAESLEPEKEESGDTATLTTQIAESGSDFTLTIPKKFHAESVTASEFEPEYELLESICISMGVNVILDYYALDISMPDVFVEYSEDVEASIHFKTPSIRSLGDGYTLVYAVNDGMIQRVKSFAAVMDKKITDLTFAINTFDSKTKIVVLTTDQPSLMLSASVNGNMAVQGISKVSFSYSVGGSSKSCSIQGITYHWVDNQQNPAYCLEPNKTFAYATNGGASSEEVGLGNSSSGRVGGNVWNALSASQRRAIALVALYGVPAGHWHSDGVAGSGNNTMYPTNANQCCFAAGQILAKPGEVCFELVTDANGRASTGSILPLGRYTVRESKAPDGYAMNTQWVQTFAVTAEKKDYAFTAAGQNACPDEVIRGGIRIIKQNASLLEKTDENAKLEGITFSVISNNENPVVVGGKSYKNGDAVLTMEIKWDGSKWSAESAADALPYGTYTVKENPMKPGQNYANGSYLLNEEGQAISVGKTNEIIEKTFLNVPRPGSIKVEKVDPNGKHLSGASFLLLWSKDGEKWARLTSSKTPGQMGGCTSENLSSGVLTTDESGIVEFTGLDTSVQYRLVEVAAPEGYSLLTEKIFEGTLPVDNVNIGFRVVNAAVFELPQTGSMSLRLTSAVAALCAMMGVCIIMKRRKEQ